MIFPACGQLVSNNFYFSFSFVSFIYFFYFFARMATVILYTEKFFHCCNCVNSKIMSSVITTHILKTGWWENSVSPNGKANKTPCAFHPCEKEPRNSLITKKWFLAKRRFANEIWRTFRILKRMNEHMLSVCLKENRILHYTVWILMKQRYIYIA